MKLVLMNESAWIVGRSGTPRVGLSQDVFRRAWIFCPKRIRSQAVERTRRHASGPDLVVGIFPSSKAHGCGTQHHVNLQKFEDSEGKNDLWRLIPEYTRCDHAILVPAAKKDGG